MKGTIVTKDGKFRYSGTLEDFASRRAVDDIEIPANNPRPSEMHEWNPATSKWRLSDALLDEKKSQDDVGQVSGLRRENALLAELLYEVLVSRGVIQDSDLPANVVAKISAIKALEGR